MPTSLSFQKAEKNPFPEVIWRHRSSYCIEKNVMNDFKLYGPYYGRGKIIKCYINLEGAKAWKMKRMSKRTLHNIYSKYQIILMIAVG